MKREGWQTCFHCGEPVAEADERTRLIANAPAHIECAIRSVIGGLNHLMGGCSCCGGTLPPDPPGLTRREAAIAAVKYWRRREAALKALARNLCHEHGLPWFNPDTLKEEPPPEIKKPAQGGPK